MHQILARALFYPSVAWNLLLCRVLNVRRWWSRVDDGVLLGALPFAGAVPGLVRAGVKGVVNMCDEYGGPVDAYRETGIRQLHLPTVDFTPPSLDDIQRGIAFIERCRRNDEVVYVHCRAGRGRGATLILCWLISAKGLAPREAQQWLQARRPHVDCRLYERDVVRRFFARQATDAIAAPCVPIAEPLVLEMVES